MTERDQQRVVSRRLAILRRAEEVTGNVSQTRRYFGITRQTFYVWLRRFEEQGRVGLRDRSRRPHHSPTPPRRRWWARSSTCASITTSVPGKIAMYLRRYHEITISPSGVWRILKRLELNRLPASQRHKTYQKRWKRYEKPQPGHRVQVDVKFITPIGGAGRRFHQFTAIDDSTRIRVLRSYPAATRRPPSSSWTTSWPSSPSGWTSSRPTTAPSSVHSSTTTCSTAASATSTSNPPPRGSTARWNDPTASTTRSSTGCWTEWSSTTPSSSATASKNGKTSSTSTDPTAALEGRLPTNG